LTPDGGDSSVTPRIERLHDVRLVRTPLVSIPAAVAAILVSWFIALPEYCLQVPANRLGYGQLTAFQLKVLQEIITLCVFIFFATFYLGERFRWNYAASFFFILVAVWFAFRS
jgi:uncharacterized protein (DUF486 family)